MTEMLKRQMAKLSKRELIEIAVSQKGVIERLTTMAESFRDLYTERVLEDTPENLQSRLEH